MQNNLEHHMERYIAIDNVCAWPNLTKMPDGAIIATISTQTESEPQ